MSDVVPGTVAFTVNGRPEEVPDDGWSLLDVLRERLGLRSVKDGCSPQGQCGCCTVLVDGEPRVACVTPIARVAGRSVTTIEGLDPAARCRADAFCAAGASQCGFCPLGSSCAWPAGAAPTWVSPSGPLCRCTGWQTIAEAVATVGSRRPPAVTSTPPLARRPRGPWTATGGARRGRRRWASPTRRPAALVLCGRPTARGWSRAAPQARPQPGGCRAAHHRAALVAARTAASSWDRTLRTRGSSRATSSPTSWCEPGVSDRALANGAPSEASGRAWSAPSPGDWPTNRPAGRVLLSRRTSCASARSARRSPPVSADGTGMLRAVRTPGLAAAVALAAPGIAVDEVDVPGPPTAVDWRGAGWVEAAVLLSSLRPDRPDQIRSPDGGGDGGRRRHRRARHRRLRARPRRGGAALLLHQGQPHGPRGGCARRAHRGGRAAGQPTITIRSFGILRAVDMPPVDVHIEASTGAPVNGSDAVFAAVAAAAWRQLGFPPEWPASRH